MSLELPRTLSPSKVAAFKDCALAFRFSAIDRLPEPPSVAATRGSLVHAALEGLFALEAPERTLEAAMASLARAAVAIRSDPEFVGLELTGEEEAAFLAEAEVLVRRYFELEDPTAVHAIGVELMLTAELGPLKLRGIIDRLDLRADGELVVTDYKTGRAPSLRHEQSRLAGVHFYALLCEELLGRRPALVQLLYLGDPVIMSTAPDEQSTRGLRRRVGALWSAVELACEREDFRPKPGPLCAWCAFQAYCPAFGGDPAAARAAVADPKEADPKEVAA